VIDFLLLLGIVYAAAGLALSVAVHVLTFTNFQPPEQLFFALHAGIFPLWIPVVFIAMKLTQGMRLTANPFDFTAMNIMFSGCPPWVRYMTYGVFAYAIINFVIFFALSVSGNIAGVKGGAPPSAVWHGFSGHWMVFYSAGLATLLTARHRGIANLQNKCRNNHPVGFNDKFCPTCGLPL